jgi:lipopolysaccharide transport system permease protein
VENQAEKITVVTAESRGPASRLNPAATAKSLWNSRWLLTPLVKRQMAARYKGSHLGFLWTLLNPLALLGIYTFVFSVILQTRWPQGQGSHSEFALALFAGLIPFNFLSETLQAAPNAVFSYRTYIRKTAFPLEILPLANLGAVLVQSLCSLCILLAGTWLIRGSIPGTVLLLALIYPPIILMCTGLAWFIAALGVYLRDTAHIVNIGLLMLFFLTPIFYPVTAVPEPYRFIAWLNPWCFITESFRNAAVWGRPPGIGALFLAWIGAMVVCQAGYAFFTARKKDFPDLV